MNIHTPAGLEAAFKAYLRNAVKGGLPPSDVTNEELGGTLLRLDRTGAIPAELAVTVNLARLYAMGSEERAGRFVSTLAALEGFRGRIHAYQLEHKISGLIEKTIELPALGFATTALELGDGLALLPGDAERLRQDARRVGGEFRALADGVGREWLRYRLTRFQAVVGGEKTSAWRYDRNDWDLFRPVVQQSACVTLSVGIDEVGGSRDLALELTAWTNPDAFNGESESLALVHPSLAARLDDADCWWC